MDIAARKNRAVALADALRAMAPTCDRLALALGIAEANAGTAKAAEALERAARYEAEIEMLVEKLP